MLFGKEAFRFLSSAHANKRKTPVPCEYANYKNPLGFFTMPHNLLMEDDWR